MKDERLYIDNTLVDISDGADITMVVMSNIFTDLSKIGGNTTYTIRLPKTIRNRGIFGYADRMDSRIGWPYREHTARYFVGGVELIHGGRASLTAATDDGYEIVITWGVSEKFATMVDKGWTLQDLPSDAAVPFAESNAMTPYATYMSQGYGYAEINTTDNDIDESEWRTEYTIDYDGSSHGQSGSGGSSSGGSGRVFRDWTTRHPSASVKWVLSQIRTLSGVEFRWSGDAKTLVESLCIPCVTKDANALTYQDSEKLAATFVSLPLNRARTLEATFSSSSNSVIFGNIPSGTRKQRFDVLVSATVKVRVSLTVWMLKSNMDVWQGSYFFPSTTIKLVVIHSDNSEDEQIIGGQQQQRIPVEYVTQSRFTETIYGEGDIDVVAGDKICVRAVSLISDQDLSLSVARNVDGLSGSMTITPTQGKDVPYGARFPIVANLPKVKITDFVKFLAIITGTFARQMSDDNVVEFVALEAAGDIQNAYDWSRRLVASSDRNIPSSVAYGMSDWCKRNWYRWKADEKVKGTYDGVITIDDDTLDAERDVIEFPFAASDGGVVPIYKYEWEQAEEGGEWTRKETYGKCEPRILQLDTVTRVSGGTETEYPVTKFALSMSDIIEEKYAVLAQMLNGCRVIEETVRISNAELGSFDETRPVWLAQFGAYWMVSEIRATGDGTARVKLVKLNNRGV